MAHGMARRWFTTKVFVDRDLYPTRLRHKKQKPPECLYVAHENAASVIAPLLEKHVSAKCNTVLELNPGLGLMSRKLLGQNQFRKIVLVEPHEHFLPNLHDIQSSTAEPGRVIVKHGDLVGLWKLAYQDKMDNGNRVSTLLTDVPKQEYSEDPSCLMLGAMGSYAFFKHLINSLVFQNSLFAWGRFEMLLVVTPPIYIHLTCTKDIGYLLYRATSMLFQILFEYRFITTVPREYFLPTQATLNPLKHGKMTHVLSIDPDLLYVVKITPRRDILHLCQAGDLPALWYFIRQNCMSRRNRVIPNMEKLVPGCGPRLIVQNERLKKSVRLLYKDDNAVVLPKYSTHCTTMSTRDIYTRMNIYTQFGDLSPSQMLTLFTQFRQWPEYTECSFLASFESSMLKLEAAADENIDEIAGENDEESVVEVEEAPAVATEQLAVKPAATKGRKKKIQSVD